MKKPFIKIITILSIIFISFSIGKTSAFAKEFYTCDYISPLTYIDQNDKPAQIELSLNYQVPYERGGLNLLPGTKYGWENVLSDNYMNSFCMIKENEKYRLGIKLYNPIKKNETISSSASISINQYNIGIYITLEISDLSSPYVMINIKNNKLNVEPASQEKFENYLKNTQYKGITDKYSRLSFDFYSEKYFANDKCVFACNMTGVGAFDDRNFIFNYVKSTGGIVFANPNLKEKYPNTQWNKFIGIMKKGGMDEETLKSKLKSVNIDTDDYNSKTYNRIYYDATKTKWEKYMEKEYKNQKVGQTLEKNQYFIQWFENVSRYIFEEDVSQFKKYFDYLYSEKINSDNDYKSMSDALEGMSEVVNVEEVEMNCLEKDPCSPYCNGDITEESEYICSGSAFNACANGSAKYKSCSTAYKKCSEESKKNCQNLGIGSSEALKTCVTNKTNDCVKNELGNDQYSELKTKQVEAGKVLEKRKQNAQNKVIMNIHNISLPSTNIDYEYKYKVKCEDFEALHTIYLILEIAAPTAVIVFGSLDYAKAVMASDIEKMEKSKKKFPKRLLLLVLFVLVPILIQIMLKLFSKTNDSIDVNTSLMKCIILGK